MMPIGDTRSRAVDVLTIGEPLIALLAEPPELPLEEATAYRLHVTGAELNVAVGLVRLGHASALVGRIGADPFGRIIRRRLEMEGVDTRWLTEHSQPTGMLLRNVRTAAPAEVVYRRAGSAGAHLSSDDVQRALGALPAGALVVSTGVTAAVCPEATATLAELTHSAGKRLCVDLNHRTRLWSADQASEGLRRLATGAHLVVGGLDEATLVTGQKGTRGAAEALLAAGARLVVLRHDSVAASWFSAESPEGVTVRSEVLTPTDPVGAGDAFMAGLLSGLLELGERSPEACLRRAHLCGRSVIATLGDIEGGLFRWQLQALEAGYAAGEPLR